MPRTGELVRPQQVENPKPAEGLVAGSGAALGSPLRQCSAAGGAREAPGATDTSRPQAGGLAVESLLWP